jgi:hypothetical protein
MGEHNSSVTRVRPVFRFLLEQDNGGITWLPRLLEMAPRNREYARHLAEGVAPLLKATRRNGYSDASFDRFFEWRSAPPEAFLRWLVQNPRRMSWPTSRGLPLTFGAETQRWREELFSSTETIYTKAMGEGVADLTRLGAKRSAQQKWAFEGFTSVDCRLQTKSLLLFVEGKRKDKLSSSTLWYKERNQLMRNLEVAFEAAEGQDYALLMIGEDAVDLDDAQVEESFPHLEGDRRDQLLSHYLGCITWKEVCQTLGVDYASLPETTGATTSVQALKGGLWDL